jgi:hypothetical protein
MSSGGREAAFDLHPDEKLINLAVRDTLFSRPLR